MTRPLDGVKIVDLSNMLMAPYATQILGDMGADIIKVEAPGGDPVRGIGPFFFAHRSSHRRAITHYGSAERLVKDPAQTNTACSPIGRAQH